MDVAPETFPFHLLPNELQQAVWQAAAPDSVNHSLYPYKPGCWIPSFLGPDDPEYDHAHPEANVDLPFRDDLLDGPRLNPALLRVCRSSRQVVQHWLRKEGFHLDDRTTMRRPRVSECDEHGHALQPRTVWRRPFDPDRDALYVSESMLLAAASGVVDRIFAADLEQRIVQPLSRVRRIAVSMGAFIKDAVLVAELYDNHGAADALLILSDPVPNTADRPDTWCQHRLLKSTTSMYNWSSVRGEFVEKSNTDDPGSCNVPREFSSALLVMGPVLERLEIANLDICFCEAVERSEQG